MKLVGGEFELMKSFVQKHCGIHLDSGKEYLIETRLSDLVAESGCTSFRDFHQLALSDRSGRLRDRIVDAMTTNETYFFRDDNLWTYLKEIAVPQLLERVSRNGSARIWSAAASTGQEAYSLAMLIDELARAKGAPQLAKAVEIVGTDISSAALFLAISGRYDSLAIRRGLSDERRRRYFTQEGNVWVLSEEIRARAKFRKFNLLDSLSSLGTFDLVLCRYVAIYFQEEVKRDLFTRVAAVLRPGSPLLLGATESLRGLTDAYDSGVHGNCTVYTRRTAGGRP
ncbi:MAG: protein-glutamate O-methyltransferase CheR [Fibrobacteria bacterium]|nr:protein-glutamate O-methyltransferase CheR [Fibrobacteria bacterium]